MAARCVAGSAERTPQPTWTRSRLAVGLGWDLVVALEARRGVSAHPFLNHTDEPTQLLMVGENRPDEVCYYPDSDKWLLRDLKLHGRVTKTDYWDGEQSPPKIKG